MSYLAAGALAVLGGAAAFLKHKENVCADTDTGEARRKLKPPKPDQFPYPGDDNLVRDTSKELDVSCGFHTNTRGEKMWWQLWTPKDISTCKGLLIWCHGYSVHSDFLGTRHLRILAKNGDFAALSVDHIGCGRSDGLHMYIPSWDKLVADFNHFVRTVGRQTATRIAADTGRPIRVFGLGQSMGGAIMADAVMLDPELVDGTVLLAPMCKINPATRPSELVRLLLTPVEWMFPKSAIVPGRERAFECFADTPEGQALAQYCIDHNTLRFTGKVRLKTGMQLLAGCASVEASMEKLTTPFLLLHGTADRMCSFENSEELYKRAQASDKTFEIFKDGSHNALCGEKFEDMKRHFDLIEKWCLDRAGSDT